MTEYDPTQSFYVQYTLPAGCTAAEMKLDGAGFPRGTRFSTDNGISYSVLCEDRPIPVEAGSQSLLVDMSRRLRGMATECCGSPPMTRTGRYLPIPLR